MKVLYAICAQMCASTCTAFGYATQKRAHMITKQTGRPCLKQVRWWIGLGIMQIGIPMNFIALLWADQSLLCTLAPFSIILSLLLGRFMLKETTIILLAHTLYIYIQQCISVCFMIIGSILSMFFTSKISHDYKIDEIKRRIFSTSSFTFITICLTFMVTFYTISYFIVQDIKKLSRYFSEDDVKHLLLKHPQAISDEMTTITINDNENVLSERLIEVIGDSTRMENLDELKEECYFNNPNWLKIPLFTFPWFAGLLSGCLTLITKCVIMIVVHISEDNNLTSPFTYLMILALPICGIAFLSSLNLGFKYFDICYVVPIFKASLVFHNTMCGGILLQEFFIYPAFNLIMYGIEK